MISPFLFPHKLGNIPLVNGEVLWETKGSADRWDRAIKVCLSNEIHLFFE